MSDSLEQRYTQLMKSASARIAQLEAELQDIKQAHSEPIAIIGMGCRFPGGAHNPARFWQLLQAGGDAIVDVPAERWDGDAYFDANPEAPGKMATRRGGFLDHVDTFDPHFFGIAPREAVTLDPQQRLLLEVSWEALEHAGLVPSALFESATGVFIGICGSDYARLCLQDDSVVYGSHEHAAHIGTGTDTSVAAGRLSYTLGLTGPSLTVDTACSSSLVALHLAGHSLRQRECDLALVGGVSLILLPEVSIVFSKAHMLAPDGYCKTFDAAANGYVRGEGCGIVVLKRLTDALADGNPILALIRGSAINQDGRSSGLTAPNGPAQQAVIRRALANAGIDPTQVSYVETHGTGTPLGDPIEVGALGAVFRQKHEHPLLLGSVKTNIGHLEAAAGMAGLIKTVLALHHGEIPPHLHLQQPTPHIPWDRLPVQVVTQRAPWPLERRIAGVSAFGFSGTNAHVVLEAAPPPGVLPVPEVERPQHVLTLSARTEAALHELAGCYDALLQQAVEVPLGDICFSANVGRTHFAHRLAVVAPDHASMREQLAACVAGTPSQGVKGVAHDSVATRIAFLFTGQGAQYVGMGRELYDTQPVFRQTLLRCDEILRPDLGGALLDVLYPAAAASALIHETAYTQPALFALEYALAELWQSWGIRPAVVLGHSVGEYVAACVAGVLSLEDGLKLIAARGRLMQDLPPNGAMVAVRADVSQLAEVLAPYAESVSIAAVNGPESVVLSGERQAVQAIADHLAATGVSTRSLTVSHAFHSPLMEPMLAAFEQVAQTVSYASPHLELVSNVTGQVVTDEVTVPAYWVQHVRAAVQFARGMTTLASQGCNVFVEVGPQPTLLGMGRRCVSASEAVWVPSLRPRRSDWQQLLESVSALYVRGVPIDWAGFDRPYHRRTIAVPTYPFQRQRYWLPETQRHRPARVAVDDSGWRDWLYEVAWQPRAVFGQRPAYMPSPHQVVQDLTPRLEAGTMQADLGRYYDALHDLDTLCLDYVGRALQQLGCVFEPGYFWTTAQLAVQLGVHPNYQRLLGRLCAMLAEAGILRWRDAGWEVLRRPVEVNPQSGMQTLRAQYADVADAELTLVGRCGPHLAEVLRGTQDALALLFPAGDDHTATSLYQDGPGAKVMNTLVQQVVLQIVNQLPAGQGVRLLEVGAGTGGTTAHVLPHLPAAQTQYVFTDIGAGFTRRAQETFREFSCMQYAQLDIEHNPTAQGFGAHQYDVVIAANVLHATRDLRETLTHIRRLLAPGGMLILVEETRPQRWLDVTFGLTEGWWRFTDLDVRPAYPLLSATAWQALLSTCGFQATAAMPGVEHTSLDQHVIIAQADEALALPGRHWLIFADSQGLGVQCAEQLKARGEVPVLVFPGQAYAQVDTYTYSIAPDAPADYEQLLATLPAVHGVVYLWSLDAPSVALVEDMETAVEQLCGQVLCLVQALFTQCQEPPALWLLTRGAQVITPGEPGEGLVQSPLWGLGRVLALEHPELRPVLLDVDAGTTDDMVQALVAECTTQGLPSLRRDDLMALRHGRRYVARLVRHCPETPTLTGSPVPHVPIRAEGTYLITGGTGGLGLEVARWLADQGARHLVLLARRPPGEEVRRQLDALAQAGIQVTMAPADVANADEVARVLAAMASEQPLRGVIHAAGVLDDGLVLQQTAERFARVLAPKVQGAWNLHTLTRHLPLDFFVVFSSATSLFGNAGQANHAAANAFLDALAHYRRALGLPALSLNWGAWSEVGSAAEYVKREQQRMTRRGEGSITPAQGIRIFADLLGRDTAQVGIMPIDWATYVATGDASRGLFQELVAAAPTTHQPTDRAPTSLSQQLAQTPETEQGAVLLRHVQAVIGRVLGLSDPEEIEFQQGFRELGLDSLMALEVQSRLETDLHHSLPATLLFDYPTLEALQEYLARDVLALEGVAPAVTAPDLVMDDELTTLLSGIEQISDAEIQQQFVGRRRGKEEEVS